MSFQRTLIAAAVLSTLVNSSFAAGNEEPAVPVQSVTVIGVPLSKVERMQLLVPATVVSGNDLRNKTASSLGDTLSGELGVSSSGFGTAASRPVIRGLEGPRVKILQNGMEVADVSSLSNDHAVGSDGSTAQQIEILRGPAALIYSSGAIGGLVNVVDGRIPNKRPEQTTGEAELRYGSVNREKSGSFSLETGQGDWALHIDGSKRQSGNYKIPGLAIKDQADSASGKLPSSDARESSFTLGSSWIQSWGFVGASVQTLTDRYGIPTDEKSFITLKQNRFDFDSLVKSPLQGIKEVKFKLGGTDYEHTENAEDGTPLTRFKNRSVDTRTTAQHAEWNGWEGSFGLQTQSSRFSALSASTNLPDAVPTTKSTSTAVFAIEQKTVGDYTFSVGARLENVKREPDATDVRARSFTPLSASVGTLWQFDTDYALGATLSSAQRAPATEELYSQGPHEATLTFDIGDANLNKERSRNLDLSLQKTKGMLRWKISVFNNDINDYVYGNTDGVKLDEEGVETEDGEFTRRFWTAGKANVRGAEAEVTYNPYAQGVFARAFADTSRGKLERGGNLPLQAANRVGFDLGYRSGAWNNSLKITHAQQQDRLASFETYRTPAYTKVDLNVNYTQAFANSQLVWFALVKNALNEDIRLSTSVLKESVPQPGRSVLAGVRVNF
jgi:iron complex outermembrane recepter protein